MAIKEVEKCDRCDSPFKSRIFYDKEDYGHYCEICVLKNLLDKTVDEHEKFEKLHGETYIEDINSLKRMISELEEKIK